MDREQSQERPERPSIMTDPDGYMRDFERRMSDLRGRADQMQERMAEASVRVESEEGEVAVTVGIGGVLTAIEFGPEARRLSGPTLSERVMETYRRAATEASQKAVDVMSDMFGPDSDTTNFMRQYTSGKE